MRPKVFLASQFFILSLFFSVLFDPVGIGYFLMGLVWIFSKKLAYFEVLATFILKGNYGFVMAYVPAVAAWYQKILPGVPHSTMMILLSIVATSGFLYGAYLGVKLSGRIVTKALKKYGPDLLGMTQ